VATPFSCPLWCISHLYGECIFPWGAGVCFHQYLGSWGLRRRQGAVCSGWPRLSARATCQWFRDSWSCRMHSFIRLSHVYIWVTQELPCFGLVCSPPPPLPASVSSLVYHYPIIPCTMWFPHPPLFRKERPLSVWVVIWEESFLTSSWVR
jgi:hypothetical protein